MVQTVCWKCNCHVNYTYLDKIADLVKTNYKNYLNLVF